MVNAYLTDADARREAGELSPLSFRDYKSTGERMVGHFGRNADPTQTRLTEFAAFRTAMAAKYAPSRLGKTVTVCWMMFRWAYESEIIETLPRFGSGFKAATKRAPRLDKAASGGKAFDVDELRTLLDSAPEPRNAMIRLGVNGGFGNMDIAKPPMSAVDLDGGWIEFPRPKSAGLPLKNCPASFAR